MKTHKLTERQKEIVRMLMNEQNPVEFTAVGIRWRSFTSLAEIRYIEILEQEVLSSGRPRRVRFICRINTENIPSCEVCGGPVFGFNARFCSHECLFGNRDSKKHRILEMIDLGYDNPSIVKAQEAEIGYVRTIRSGYRDYSDEDVREPRKYDCKCYKKCMDSAADEDRDFYCDVCGKYDKADVDRIAKGEL